MPEVEAHAALSRADNETYVCPLCGGDEAMVVLLGSAATQRRVLPSWAQKERLTQLLHVWGVYRWSEEATA